MRDLSKPPQKTTYSVSSLIVFAEKGELMDLNQVYLSMVNSDFG
jgi:hypothetical protein